jgi:hypothetical protein
MSNKELSYKEYNKKSYAVRGNKEKYESKIKPIGGRWNPRMKDGAGWLVPKESLDKLKLIKQSKKKVEGVVQPPPSKTKKKQPVKDKLKKLKNVLEKEFNDTKFKDNIKKYAPTISEVTGIDYLYKKIKNLN